MEIMEGKPVAPGIYVAYVNPEHKQPISERTLLMWSEGKWWHRMGDVAYRGHVYGWIGPLPTLPLED